MLNFGKFAKYAFCSAFLMSSIQAFANNNDLIAAATWEQKVEACQMMMLVSAGVMTKYQEGLTLQENVQFHDQLYDRSYPELKEDFKPYIAERIREVYLYADKYPIMQTQDERKAAALEYAGEKFMECAQEFGIE